MICRPMMQRIDDWYKNGWLGEVFEKALTLPDNSFFFQTIYVPYRDVVQKTIDGETKLVLEDEWHYENCGWSESDVTDAYWAEYGGNFFNEYFKDGNEFLLALGQNRCEVERMIHAVFGKNKIKYKKMIELLGFAYDPLNNVDAHEMFSVLENHGGETHDNGGTNTIINGTDMKTTHNVAPYDGGTKEEYNDTTEGNGASATPSVRVNTDTFEGDAVTKPSSMSSSVGQNKMTLTHNEAVNMGGDFGSGRESHAYHVSGKDNAFGEELWGADYYKAEKHRRYGNIGVTKTQELLASERENLRFNLLSEFFNDINEAILVGIY